MLRLKSKPDMDISIHALLAESDCVGVGDAHLGIKFLSTLSLRRATQGPGFIRHGVNFYPRSPCGERRKQGRHYIGCKIFLSTLSLRRATKRHIRVQIATPISIHALLAESDF